MELILSFQNACTPDQYVLNGFVAFTVINERQSTVNECVFIIPPQSEAVDFDFIGRPIGSYLILSQRG